MNSLADLGKILVVLGLLMVFIGVFLLLVGRISGLGRLPGDIFVQKGNFTFYFPVVTMLIVSVVLTVLISLFFRK